MRRYSYNSNVLTKLEIEIYKYSLKSDTIKTQIKHSQLANSIHTACNNARREIITANNKRAGNCSVTNHSSHAYFVAQC